MDPQKRSAVEDQKEASRQLRGSIALELGQPHQAVPLLQRSLQLSQPADSIEKDDPE